MNDSVEHKLKFPYRKVRCQYCNVQSVVVMGRTLYGMKHKLANREFYSCLQCQAWVGMHEISKKPFGSLAKAELRQKRVLAHSLFDKVWLRDVKNGKSKSVARSDAYTWLADSLGLPIDKCHIGNFNIEECNRVMSLCFKLRSN